MNWRPAPACVHYRFLIAAFFLTGVFLREAVFVAALRVVGFFAGVLRAAVFFGSDLLPTFFFTAPDAFVALVVFPARARPAAALLPVFPLLTVFFTFGFTVFALPAAVFFPVAFFAVVFFAVVFFAAVFFATGFFAATFVAAAFCAGAFPEAGLAAAAFTAGLPVDFFDAGAALPSFVRRVARCFSTAARMASERCVSLRELTLIPSTIRTTALKMSLISPTPCTVRSLSCSP
jgi:hypothetical protein